MRRIIFRKLIMLLGMLVFWGAFYLGHIKLTGREPSDSLNFGALITAVILATIVGVFLENYFFKKYEK